MPRKFTPGFLDHAVKLIAEGKNITETAVFLACDRGNLAKALRAYRPEFNPTANRFKSVWNRQDLPQEEICAKYQSGKSELALAMAYSVQRSAIRRVLLAGRVPVRGRSSANYVRMSKMTPEERKSLAAKAHEARRNAPSGFNRKQRLKRSKDVEAGKQWIMTGPGEVELFTALSAQHPDAKRQVAVDVYLIDIAFGSVAVEVKFGAGGRFNAMRDVSRMEKIIEAGYSIAYVRFTDRHAIANALDEIVALLNVVGSKPPSACEYWMVRSGLQKSPLTRFNGNKRPAIEAPPELVTTVRKVQFR